MPNVIPKPFKKDSIAISGTHGKSWQVLPLDKAEPGDMVLDHGLVVKVEHASDPANAIKVKFQSGEVIVETRDSFWPYPEYSIFTRKR